ncbi:MAG TPA: hypothetical protein VFS34_09350 [Thermoanaerobaculia bacterium]|nr:hypothetical protein [Thermoanaerobaculia bacterium]
MSVRRLLILPALAAAAIAPVPARAGATFTATTRVEGPARRLAGIGGSTVRGWVDAERGKIEFVESDNPATPKGDVLLTTDGGKTLRYFDLERKECRPWTPPAARETRIGPGSPVSTSFRNVRVEKVLDDAGPVIAGLSTRHCRVKSEYDTLLQGQGSSRRAHTVTIDDLWVAEELRDPAFSVWLTKGSPGAAGGELGAKLDAVLTGVPGAPVRRVTSTTVAFDGGRPATTTTRTEVTGLHRETIPPPAFDPPLDCTKRTGHER